MIVYVYVKSKNLQKLWIAINILDLIKLVNHILIIKTLLFLFLPTGLSSSARHLRPRNPELYPDIHYYADENNTLIPLIEGLSPQIVRDQNLMIGIYIGDLIRPIFDRDQRQVVVDLRSRQNVHMTPALYQRYGHVYQVSRGNNNNNQTNGQHHHP